MPNYVKSGPFTNGSAPGINNTFLNNVENVFAQPTGGTEVGQYFIEGGATGAGWTVGQWIPSLSRTSTPVSISVDTALVAPVTLNAPTTQQLNANGFFVGASATSNSFTARCGGNYTIQY